MTTIWKYTLDIVDSQDIQMPEYAEILCVAEQDGDLCMWVEVKPDATLTSRHIEIRGTGHPIPLGLDKRYIGTVPMQNRLVWHVFEMSLVAIKSL